MKRLLLITGTVLALGISAQANIIPTSTGFTGSGPDYTWTYDMKLSGDQNVNSGFAPPAGSVAHTNLTFAGFVTIYDFAGYVAGSCAGPVGWTCTVQTLGSTPDDVIPVDNPNVVNLTWAYTSGPTLLGEPSGMDLGTFSAESIFNLAAQDSYASRGIKNSGPSIGTIADNVGNTEAPFSGVPEPSSIVMMSGGLGLLACFGLFRKTRRAVV